MTNVLFVFRTPSPALNQCWMYQRISTGKTNEDSKLLLSFEDQQFLQCCQEAGQVVYIVLQFGEYSGLQFAEVT